MPTKERKKVKKKRQKRKNLKQIEEKETRRNDFGIAHEDREREKKPHLCLSLKKATKRDFK